MEFKNVCFSYDRSTENNVLTDISFTVNPGETVGILGATGSGKTSLVQLIPRLYDVKSGSVLVDGIDVRDYSLSNLRDGVGMVLQKNVLFSGTVMENLKWGNENAIDEEIYESAKYAEAYGFVTANHEGFERELGQGGVNVSGGQRQRLCIARALLKKPRILILDDSSSALDYKTDASLRQALRENLKESTVITVAQRVSSIKHCELIIVLDHGNVIGMGKHDELLENCPEYKEISDSQMGGDFVD